MRRLIIYSLGQHRWIAIKFLMLATSGEAGGEEAPCGAWSCARGRIKTLRKSTEDVNSDSPLVLRARDLYINLLRELFDSKLLIVC